LDFFAAIADWLNDNQGVTQVVMAALGATAALAAGIWRFMGEGANQAGKTVSRTMAMAGQTLRGGLDQQKTIAVLPFANFSQDAAQEHLADGITEDLITLFAKEVDLDVVARNSVFAYKGQSPDIREVGQKLGAGLVLEGSLRTANDLVRVTAQLIDARNGYHLWADRFDRPAANTLAVQDEICGLIKDGITSEVLEPQPENATPAPQTAQLEAPAPKEDQWAASIASRVHLPKTQFAGEPGQAVAYDIMGDHDLDLVVANGVASHLELGMSAPGMPELMSDLTKFARVIRFDKRGQGLSDPTHGAPDIEERMDDIGAVMDAAGSKKAFIWGTSDGAPMSLLYAATHPDRVAGLILLGGFARLVQTEGYTAGLTPDQVGDIPEIWGTGRFLQAAFPAWRGLPGYLDFCASFERLSASPSSIRAQSEMIFNIDVRATLPAIQAPTLVVHWTGDRLVPYSCGEYLAANIKNAELLTLEGEDHAAFDQQGVAVAAIREFCQKHGSAVPKPQAKAVLAAVAVIKGGIGVDEINWVTDIVNENGGRILMSKVDGQEQRLGVFDGPARAVRCADGVAAALSSMGRKCAIAVHTGLVQTEGDSVAGAVIGETFALNKTNDDAIIVSTPLRRMLVGAGFDFEMAPGNENAYKLKSVS
jgi:TolB-like protein/pimeloyl-ACP methyl ester carboxylesterase